jgi:mRNA interferase MazF
MEHSKQKRVLRGQMYLVKLDPIVGSEQGGTRPALVIQNDVGNRHSPTTIVAPITTHVKNTWLPTHVTIPPMDGLPSRSMAMLERVRAVDKHRLKNYMGHLDDTVMESVNEAIGVSLGLNHTQSMAAQEEPPADEMVLPLCEVCLSQFLSSTEHVVKRVDPVQGKKPCAYCDVRDGYEYRIIHRKKRLGDN